MSTQREISVSGVEFSQYANLKAKQDYYRYTERPLRFKEPPILDKTLASLMEHERLDRAYRFVWGGVVLVREEPNSSVFTIAKGSRTACHDVGGVIMPKYIHERARQARGFYYTDDLGQKICTTREELVPPDRIARVDYRYVDFGRLYWHIEQRCTGEDLVNASVYDRNEAVPESEWICVMPLVSKNGLYYEPGLELIDVLKHREWENRNANMKEVAAAMMLRSEKNRVKREENSEAEEKKEFDAMFDDVVRDVEKKTAYSI